jgi:hypothetical protein
MASLIISGSPKSDVQRLGLRQDYATGTTPTDNVTILQAELDSPGFAKYPYFFPGPTSNNTADYIFSNTIKIPPRVGLRFEGMGAGTPSGTATGYNNHANLTMRGISYATTFDGTTNKLTAAGTSATVTVTGRATTAADKYQSVEITGGTNATAGWYGIESVSVGASGVGTWTLDRNWCTGAVTAGTGFFCPELIMCGGHGTLFDGITFKGRRLTSDDASKDPSVLFHQLPTGYDSAANAGKTEFRGCGFYGAKVGLMCGVDMRYADYDTYSATWPAGTGSYQANHADHTNMNKIWFQELETCVLLRSQQSVSHSFRDLRCSEITKHIFRVDSGGVIDANGLWISGSNPCVVSLGGWANWCNIVIQQTHFDHASVKPQLVVMDDNCELRTNVTFNGGQLSATAVGDNPITDPNYTLDAFDSAYKPNWYLLDLIGNAYVAVSDFCARSYGTDIKGFWPKSLKLRQGATTSTLKPYVRLTGVTLWVEDAEDVIDLVNSSSGATVEFIGCHNFNGTPYKNGRYVVGTGWNTTTSGWS